jgi:DNA-nicking Smr family endonuclease
VRAPPRGLSPEEAELWARLASTVRPMHPLRKAVAKAAPSDRQPPPPPRPAVSKLRSIAPPPPPPVQPKATIKPRTLDVHGLDSTWERRLAKAEIQPDFTLDLHGHSLDAAHTRLDHGLMQALAQGARLVLLITGRPRPADDHGQSNFGGRSERRGAIRAKYLDWLASGPHASRIAAVRPAHPRHGGAGAVYIVLRKPR